jgi:hypothetical protein
LWLSYVFVLFYLAVAVGAVSHVDLFLEKPVKLPFLNIELPLLPFFLVAPILFLVVHAYTLVHLGILGDKAKWFHRELYSQVKIPPGLTEVEDARRRKIRTDLRRQLPSNIFVQLLAGPGDLRKKGFGFLLRVIASVTLIVAPVLLLLLTQVQFLPFHSSFITWTHRGVLVVDLALLWGLWGWIFRGHAERGRSETPANLLQIGLLLTFVVVFFSWIVATFPGEPQESFLAKWDQPKWTVTPHNWLFGGPVDQTTRRRTSLFSSTLVLPGLNTYEGLGVDDPNKTKWHDVFQARGRILSGAILDFAVMPRVDFTRAQLQGASLVQADLQSVSLDGAQLQGAKLDGARLQGASLESVNLQAASLNGAQLQGANLDFVDLRGAAVDGAHLQGSSLESAQLQAADPKRFSASRRAA